MTTSLISNNSEYPTHAPTTEVPNPDELLSPLGYNIIGTIFAFLSLLGFLSNGCELLVFVATKTLRSPTNLFLMALCISDLLMALCSSVACAASFQHGWVFGDTLCTIEGFSVFFLGLTSMYLLAAISLDRYIVIVRPISGSKITKRIAVMVIVMCWTLGFFWAILPLVGWNHYTTEGVGISCSVVWNSPNGLYISYIITIFIFCLIIPLCLMIFSYFNIYITIRGIARNSVWKINSRVAQKNQRLERKMLKTAITLVGVYIVSWLPYAVVSFLAAFGSPGLVTPLMATIPALIAKCSGLWNPMIYVMTNAQFRKAFLDLFRCSKGDDILETKECKTDISLDINKTSKQSCSGLADTDVDMKDSLLVTDVINGKARDTGTGHDDSEETVSLSKAGKESEALELSDISIKC